MSVAVDATATADTYTTATTTNNNANLTVGTGSNRALIAVASFDIQAPGTLAANWDSAGTNQAMTLIVSKAGTGTSGFVAIFGLVAPTSGNKNLKVTCTTTTDDFYVSCMSFTGVNQTGGATSFPNSTSGVMTTATGSITITSAAGHYTFSGVTTGNAVNTASVTLLYNDHTSGIAVNGAAGYATGSATVTHTYNLSGSESDTPIAGTDIAPAAGGFSPYQPYFQQMVASRSKGFVGWRDGYDNRWRKWRRERSKSLILPTRHTLKRAA